MRQLRGCGIPVVMSKLTTWPIPKSWEGPISEWSAWLRVAGRRPATVHTRTLHIRSLARGLGTPLQDVTEQELLEWLGTRNWSPTTRNSQHASITGFFRFIWRHEPARDPSQNLQRVPNRSGVPRPAPSELIRTVVKDVDERTRLMILLMANYGLRVGEVVLVSLLDIFPDLVGHSLLVHGKGGKERAVPLDPRFYADLKSYGQQVGGRYIFAGQQDGHLSAAWAATLVRRELGGPWTAHTLRHRFGTEAYAATRDILALADLMGHANPSTTRGYVRVSRDDLSLTVAAAALEPSTALQAQPTVIALQRGGRISVGDEQLHLEGPSGSTTSVSISATDLHRLQHVIQGRLSGLAAERSKESEQDKRSA